MDQQFNYADGCIAIFHLKLFDHRVLDENKSFSFEVDLEYPPELHEQTTTIHSPLR